MDIDREIEEHIAWLRSLYPIDDEFRAKAREVFSSTQEMDVFLVRPKTETLTPEPVYEAPAKGRHRKR
jgi:hypothetical protein